MQLLWRRCLTDSSFGPASRTSSWWVSGSTLEGPASPSLADSRSTLQGPGSPPLRDPLRDAKRDAKRDARGLASVGGRSLKEPWAVSHLFRRPGSPLQPVAFFRSQKSLSTPPSSRALHRPHPFSPSQTSQRELQRGDGAQDDADDEERARLLGPIESPGDEPQRPDRVILRRRGRLRLEVDFPDPSQARERG